MSYKATNGSAENVYGSNLYYKERFELNRECI